MNRRWVPLSCCLLSIAACASNTTEQGQSGGAAGVAAGGATTGGATTGGSATNPTGGMASVSGGAASTTGGALEASGGTAINTGGALNARGGAATGGTATGGTAGASMGTGGSAGGGADPCAKALFCENFEKYAAGSMPTGTFKVQVNSGAIAIDESQHASGAKSVKLTTLAKDGSKTALLRLEANGVFPVPGNVFYGRMLFLLESAPTASVHWTLIQAGGLVAGQSYHSLYRYGGQQPVTQNGTFVGSQLMANYETPDSYAGTGPKSDCWFHANKRVVPTGKWSCVEWKFDGPNNQMRMWLDGVALPDLDVNGVGQGCVNQPATYPWTAPTFDHLDVGWESYQNDEARTLYIDDLIVSTSPIGCPQ